MVEGFDFSFNTPDFAAAFADGKVFAISYLSPQNAKNWSSARLAAAKRAGLTCWWVWESSQGRATEGRAAGVEDATAALAMAKRLGLVEWGFWAVDTDVDWPSVADYGDGWASVIAKDISGPYGGKTVVAGATAEGWKRCWQTYAWSGGSWVSDPGVVAQQYQNGVTVGDANCDLDRTTASGDALLAGNLPAGREEIQTPTTPNSSQLT